MKKRFRGLTLIELVMVCFILGVLAALLFPVFATARLSAKTTSAVGQLRQLGAALQLYRIDYEDGGEVALPDYRWCYSENFPKYFGKQNRDLWISPCGTHPDMQRFLDRSQTNLMYLYSPEPEEGYVKTLEKKGESAPIIFDLNCNSHEIPVTEGEYIRKTALALKLDGSVERKSKYGSPYDPDLW